MKLAIFGATGRTGIPLVRQALEANHQVVALARTPAKMPISDPDLTVIQGDAMNADDVERTIAGTDAVLVALGHSRNTPDNMQTIATKHIINAMKKHNVRRLISLTGAGVAAPQDKPGIPNHLIKFAMRTFAGRVLADGENHAEVIRNSGLDWVIVRGPRLTEGPHTGDYRVGWVGINTGMQISREDVADFMLKQVTDSTHLNKAPMISD